VARLREQFGYAYDKGWNLSQRTNNSLIQSFSVNNLNELGERGGAGRRATKLAREIVVPRGNHHPQVVVAK
jgi:hypothetical protein